MYEIMYTCMRQCMCVWDNVYMYEKLMLKNWVFLNSWTWFVCWKQL